MNPTTPPSTSHPEDPVWAKSRPTARSAFSHAPHLRVFKLVSVGLTALIILSLTIWYQFKESKITHDSRQESTQAQMSKPNYYGTDEKQRPFTITADRAIQTGHNTNIFNLEKPHAHIKLSEEKWTQVSAQFGEFNQIQNTLILRQNVILLRDDNQEFHTEYAFIDLNTGYVSGDKLLTGFGPKGNISSQGFEILDYGQQYIFNGKSQLIIPLKSEGAK